MLTATYTLVALSVEQASVRLSLQAFQKYLHSNLLCQNALAPGQVDDACDALTALYDSWHWRKVDMFLIPAIRKSTRDADALLHDLDALSVDASEVIGAIGNCLRAASVDTQEEVARFCHSIEAFCSSLLKRLEREEQELFPVARAVISGDAWFSIANDMLVHDARRKERKRRPKAAQIAKGGAPAMLERHRPDAAKVAAAR